VSAASDITRRAKSNLAIALRILPPERRAGAEVFYAYCRTLDDLADDPALPFETRLTAIREWKRGLLSGFAHPTPLQREVISLRDRLAIPNHLLTAIADGCEADLTPRAFATWEELDAYIWQVACAVGLVSIRIFGCKDPAAEPYAEALGRALQLTNILRDIGEDLDRGRIYLPGEDLARFGLDATKLAARPSGGAFIDLMKFETRRAEGFYQRAAALLPAADRRALAPARMMASIYQLLLARMEADGFRVFAKRYRISRARKLLILAKHVVAG
jgi:15-cis-phytoene synthase